MPFSHEYDHSVIKLLGLALFSVNNSAIKLWFEHYSNAFIGDDNSEPFCEYQLRYEETQNVLQGLFEMEKALKWNKCFRGRRKEEEGEKTRIAKSVRMIIKQKYSSVHNVLKATRFTLERRVGNQNWNRGYFIKLIFD